MSYRGLEGDGFKYCKKLFFFLFIYTQGALACMGEPSVAELRDGVRIIARAQNGLRLEGKYAVPKVIVVEPIQETQVGLKIVGQAKGFKDSRNLFERIFDKPQRFETFLIPKTLELIPERNTDNELRYKVKFKDGSELLNVELLFQGGMVKTLRGGCGDGKAQIEPL
jgi:hypothetical protein